MDRERSAAMNGTRLGVCLVFAGLACGCGNDDAAPPPAATLGKSALMNPETCAECHPKHYDEWSRSMHAYASDDPLFVAMNARGQREANIGPFCVKCHAPMA